MQQNTKYRHIVIFSPIQYDQSIGDYCGARWRKLLLWVSGTSTCSGILQELVKHRNVVSTTFINNRFAVLNRQGILIVYRYFLYRCGLCSSAPDYDKKPKRTAGVKSKIISTLLVVLVQVGRMCCANANQTPISEMSQKLWDLTK